MPPPGHDPNANRLLGGRYRLERRIGQGGMGAVYKAQDNTMDRVVAVKLLRKDDSDGDDAAHAERFLREARHTAKLVHEHIVEVYDLGRSDEGELYFVMELLSGEPLSRLLKRERRVEPRRAIRMGMQLCRALSEAHTLGIVHRDLKPGNIMLVQRPDGKDFAKVLDFGVAKSLVPSAETQLTHTGMLVGTLEYMAPEQIYGRVIDTRIDIYAFGALMYRCLSGAPMFVDAEGPGILQHQLHTVPESLLTRAPDANVPQALDRIVQKCLEKGPERRYQTMKELEAALSDALTGDLSHLPSLEYRDSVDTLAWDDPSAPILGRIPKAPTSDTRVDRIHDKSFVSCERCSAKMAPYAIRCPECQMPRAAPVRRGLVTPTPNETPIATPMSVPIPISVGPFAVEVPSESASAKSFDDSEGLPMSARLQAPWWKRLLTWMKQ